MSRNHNSKKTFLVLLSLLVLFSVIAAVSVITVNAATPWAPNTFYAVGAIVTYNGVDYQCIQAHTSLVGWEPPNVPALWSPIGTSATPTNTNTNTPTASSAATPTNTNTNTPTASTGATPTNTNTNTPTTGVTPTATNTNTPTSGLSPVAINGQLQVIGTKLCNQYGKPIQLRGMSTHGIQWYYNCLTTASLDVLAYEWKADILRISLYVQEGGYETDPAGFTAKVKNLINQATTRGMYALVDWHQLTPGDPNYNLAYAKTFFTEIAQTYKNQNNIIYDVCNEPNGCTWAQIKTYADQIIPVIRAIDSDAVILIGTHGWASLGVSDGRTYQDIVNNPVNFPNIMYTFHFYAASHGTEYYNALDAASNVLPIFVTEFGTQTYTGDGANNFTMSQQYLDLMRAKKISWTNWNYSDDFRSGAVFKVGTAPDGPWSGTAPLKEAGIWVRDKIMNPPDDFPTN